MKRLFLALCLVVTGSILASALIVACFFWGYHLAVQQGYDANDVAITLMAVMAVVFIAILVGLMTCLRSIRSEFWPLMAEPISFANHVSHGLNDAVHGFMEGFKQGKTARKQQTPRYFH